MGEEELRAAAGAHTGLCGRRRAQARIRAGEGDGCRGGSIGGSGRRPGQRRWWQRRAGGRRQVELEQRRQRVEEEQRRRRVEEQRRRQVEEEQRGIDGLGWAFLPTLDPLVSNGPFLHSSHFMSTDLLFFFFCFKYLYMYYSSPRKTPSNA